MMNWNIDKSDKEWENYFWLELGAALLTFASPMD